MCQRGKPLLVFLVAKLCNECNLVPGTECARARLDRASSNLASGQMLRENLHEADGLSVDPGDHRLPGCKCTCIKNPRTAGLAGLETHSDVLVAFICLSVRTCSLLHTRAWPASLPDICSRRGSARAVARYIVRAEHLHGGSILLRTPDLLYVYGTVKLFRFHSYLNLCMSHAVRINLCQLCVCAGGIAAAVQHGVAGVQRPGSGARSGCCCCWSARSAAAAWSTVDSSRALSARLCCRCGGPAAPANQGSGSSAGQPSSAAHRLRCKHRAESRCTGAACCALQSEGRAQGVSCHMLDQLRGALRHTKPSAFHGNLHGTGVTVLLQSASGPANMRS